MPQRRYATMPSAATRVGLTGIARYLLPLMLRNMASAGFVFTDPAALSRVPPDADAMFSVPGCIVASPSFERLGSVRQNYVFNWTRDAAVVATEIAHADLPVLAGAGSGPLDDYVSFAALCQANAPGLDTACYTLAAKPRENWSLQNDGPALQTMAVLTAFPQLDEAMKAQALAVVARNLDFLLENYANPAVNLWEETHGQSFFTRSVQLRCLTEVRDNTLGIAVPPAVDVAIDWLRAALDTHWNGEVYVSVLNAQNPRPGYDPNIDVVAASVYGAVACTDPRLLATAARLRRQWADPASPTAYPINEADAAAGLGPMLGRYPGDVYDGDLDDPGTHDHPWALCTANFAQLYYELAAAVAGDGRLPGDPLATDFLAQVGIQPVAAAADAARSLRDAGDRMLRAVLYHSDHFELSEQFDGATGFEKSVRNLTWSYAAVLSAVRARDRLPADHPGGEADPG